MTALLIVDVQNDFCPGGALAAPEGDAVVPVINTLLDHFPLAIASKDWHPSETKHFLKWPRHCVQQTPGAEFYPKLEADKIAEVFLKGTGLEDDGYSFFEATNLDPERYLKDRGVDALYICGLATDYCVKASALDALARGFRVFVIEDAIRGVGVNPGDVEKAVMAMKEKGAKFVRSTELLN